MLNCKKISELISKKIDRELTLFEKFSLKFHQLMCPACTQFETDSDLITKTIKKSNSCNDAMCPEKKRALQDALKINN